jgi:NAD(P)H-dependent FMN reductase
MAALRTAQVVAPPNISVEIYRGIAGIPPFNPDHDRAPLLTPVAALRVAIHEADALLFATPEYAGALPGAFKNLLDWTIGDDRPRSVSDKPVGWINTSPRGAADAHTSLRNVLRYAHAHLIERACVDIPFTSAEVDAQGIVANKAIHIEIRATLKALAHAAAAAAA